MTATVIPFRSAAHRQVYASLAELQALSRRETARLMAEQKAALEEAECIRRGYEARQKKIERLLAHIHADVERA